MKNQVVVTGAGGFIGHHLVKRLVAEGHYVIGVDIKLPEFEPTAAHDFLVRDLRIQHDVQLAIPRGTNEVYALAADMGGMGFIGDRRNDVDILHNNLLINLLTLERARTINPYARYLFTSSACVYPMHLQDSLLDAAPLAEEDAYPAQPEDPYGWEKLITEQHVLAHRLRGMDVRILRFHNVYGPLGTWRGGREKAPAALCRKVAEAVQSQGTSIEVWGDGHQVRSFMYIDDCIMGIQRIMASGYDQPLNLGSAEAVSINELAHLIMDTANVNLEIEHREGPRGVLFRNSDNRKIRQVLNGWEPTIMLHEGITLTYAWIEQQVREATG